MKWWSPEVGSSVPLFDRIVGLETEYAIRFHPNDPAAPKPSDYRLYQLVVRELSQRVLAVQAHHLKEGVFIANGGAIWFERVRYTGDIGLIESATPECRGPRQALTY